MMLGDLLGAARRAAGDIVSHSGAVDEQSMARLERLALSQAESPTTLVRRAIAEFERAASEEDWATLISRLREADDPGTACLAATTRWYVARLASRATSAVPERVPLRTATAVPAVEPSEQPLRSCP